MIRAIFLDVDGTLVSFRTHEVPASARDALARTHERGVRLFIATGREANDLEPLAGIPYDGVASLNGSRCVGADGRVVARHPIPQEEFDRALALARQYDFPIALELEEGIFVDRVTPVVERLAREVAHPVPVATDIVALFRRSECCQLCFYLDAELERRVMRELPGLTANRWSPLFTDINVRGVDKAAGMRPFLDLYGIRIDACMAIGDGGNDVPMLRAADVGVAMGNATPEALAAADYVTGSVDEDGIALALRQYGIIEA